MPESARLGVLGGVRLPLGKYREEFRAAQWAMPGQDSWKLERRQHFREPGFASWEAFARGDWDTALRLMEDEREYLAEFSAKAAQLGIALYRVRVVEEPIDPYLQWELHLLKLRAECGELIRVLTGNQVSLHEADGPLPEIVTLGSSTLYHILYDDMGELTGAVRVTDPSAVAAAAELARHLYERGEDLAAFFERLVAPLPPPGGDPSVS
jgi:hypothetical protein